jgi:Protein of unknown function (DUF1501)
MQSTHRHAIGINRRELLQVGYSGLIGLGLSQFLNAAEAPKAKKAKSVIVVFLTGAASHIDTFDPKPEAPVEIRGEFKPIATKVPGIQYSEHLPMLAARADKLAIVRSLTHRDDNHLGASHYLVTGTKQPNGRFDKPLSRDDWPSYAAGLSYLKPPAAGIPAGVTLPTFLAEGPLVWPGQHGGFLGAKHDPWQINQDPNGAKFRVDNAQLMPGLDVNQFKDRLELLASVDRQQSTLAESLEARKMSDQQKKAAELLLNGAVAKAFDLNAEKPADRDRYGRHMFGQSLLLARRLVQAGVPMIQANMGKVQNWDSHGNNFGRLKNDLLPPLDRGVSALLDDLTMMGLLDDVMVVVVSEFGRTPKVNKDQGGRDHWARCFSAAFAGGGVRGGQVLGKSDKTASDPTMSPFTPEDLGATVYHQLGVDHTAEVKDRTSRPVQLNRGTVMQALFNG